jgi:nucleoid-associated protein YejK
MGLDFGTLQVDKLIIHEIPRRRTDQPTSLRVTDVESTLDQDDRNFFSERIKESLLKSSHDVAFNSESDSPVPKLIFKALSKSSNKKENFVNISQSIATHLYGCQTGVNPPGVLVIAQIKLANKPSLAILKLEKEEGMQFSPEENDQGKIICNVKQLPNLMMTGGKVFKVGIFINELEDISSVRGYVSDKQRGIRSNTEVAKFFLEDFLGCYLLESPEIQTKKFFKTCQDFINEQVESPERKAKYEIALLSVLQSNQNIIEPTNFASLYLDIDDRQNFINCLSKSQIPINSFDKNINSIRSWTKSMHLSFNDISISISGDPSAFKSINIQEINNGKVQVSFEAEFDKVGR